MSPNSSIHSEMRDGVEIFSLCEGDNAYAEIVPVWGNNCFAFCVQGEPILEPVPFEVFRQRPMGYGIPILFPFPNRIRDGKFRFRETCYAVEPNRHGFVRDKRWKVDAMGASDEEGAWIRSSLDFDKLNPADAAQYPDQILNQFPFPFRIQVTYRLKAGRLEMETQVQNTGQDDMPCGFGIHPYFRLPERGTIQVPARKRWELEDFLPTGKLLDVRGHFDLRHPTDLTGLVLDDIFTDLVSDSDGLVRCRLNDQQKGIQTLVEFDPKQFPHLVVYTPPAPRQAIAIEPYTCPTDAFNLHERGVESNLIVLQPKQTIRFKVCIYARITEA